MRIIVVISCLLSISISLFSTYLVAHSTFTVPEVWMKTASKNLTQDQIHDLLGKPDGFEASVKHFDSWDMTKYPYWTMRLYYTYNKKVRCQEYFRSYYILNYEKSQYFHINCRW